MVLAACFITTGGSCQLQGVKDDHVFNFSTSGFNKWPFYYSINLQKNAQVFSTENTEVEVNHAGEYLYDTFSYNFFNKLY